MTTPEPPADPFGDLEEMAAHTAEMFNAFVKSGIPPHHVAVIIGTWLASVPPSEPSDG